MTASIAGTLGCYVTVERGSWDTAGPDPESDAAEDDDGDDGADGDDAPAEAEPAPRAQLRRLTRAQYAAAIGDLLGAEVVIPEALDPDLVVDLFASVGATTVTTSPLGSEHFEVAAAEISAQVFDDPDAAATLVACDPAAASCLSDFARHFAERAFRRPLSDDEVDAYAQMAGDVSTLRDDPWAGAEAIVAAVLSSPSFLYIVEIGEPDPEDSERWRFTSLEMASRLAFAIWGSVPDATLREAAAAGELVDPAVIAAQAERMMLDPRAAQGIGRFVAEWLGVDAVAGLSKDSTLFPESSPELFASMQGEITRLVGTAALDPEASFLDIVDAEHTYVDARLADLYGVAMPADVDDDGFGRVELPEAHGRRGVLGTAAFLASQSRRTRTSPTLRGIYVQARLRCVELAPPPPGTEMGIPEDVEGADGAPTLRERLVEHRENPVCASCHDVVDPIGLALEHFDALGQYRATEAGATIDDSTNLEGKTIDGLAGLTEALRSDPLVADCIVRQLFRFTTGHRELAIEAPALEALAIAFADSDFNLRRFVPQLLSSPAFRTLAAPQ